jgi:oligoribonuclease
MALGTGPGTRKRQPGGQMMSRRLIWIDLEMSGLDPERHVIVEMASLVTDEELQTVAEGPEIAIHHPKEVLDLMEAWSREHHQASGLMDRILSSPYDTAQAEEETLRFLKQYCREGASPLCGNTVWQDRRFLIKYMPTLESFLHYRNIDVSSVKELVSIWYPHLEPFSKQDAHRAMADIKESVGELEYYRKCVFVEPT